MITGTVQYSDTVQVCFTGKYCTGTIATTTIKKFPTLGARINVAPRAAENRGRVAQGRCPQHTDAVVGSDRSCGCTGTFFLIFAIETALAHLIDARVNNMAAWQYLETLPTSFYF